MKTPREVCSSCGGKGKVHLRPSLPRLFLCYKCNGTGQVDWVSQITKNNQEWVGYGELDFVEVKKVLRGIASEELSGREKRDKIRDYLHGLRNSRVIFSFSITKKSNEKNKWIHIKLHDIVIPYKCFNLIIKKEGISR